MRKLLLIIGSVALLSLPMSAFAGVQSSDHDLTGSGENLCNACHVPHNAEGVNLWARTTTGTFTGVQELCYTCHNGDVTSIGGTTVFNASLEQHKTLGTADCSGDGACHDVHNQNPNTTGRFLVAGVTQGPLGDWCTPCHDGSAPADFSAADALGDHTYGGANTNNHYMSASFDCNQCHSVHGSKTQTQLAGDVTSAAILLEDNHNGTYYGDFCISCHSGTLPTAAMPGTGGVVSSDVFDYSMATNDGTENKHPTISTTPPTPLPGCDGCHDVHNPGPITPAPDYLLLSDNANSAFCRSCHQLGTSPQVGANTHPDLIAASDNGMNSGLPALPWAHQIDDDNNTLTSGADYAGTTDFIVCESCHSVHRNGLGSADGSGFFLREANGSLNELCSRCHSTN
jgi:predicted CXXCH cytochrome family protein